MQSKPFGSDGGNLSGLTVDLVPITKSNTTTYEPALIGLHVKGDAGDVEIETVAGNVRVYPMSNDGFLLPCGVVRVLATNTTATDIWAFVP